MFAVAALQNLLFPRLLDFVFLFDWQGSRGNRPCVHTGNEEGRGLDGEHRHRGQERGTAKFPHENPPLLVSYRKWIAISAYRLPGTLRNVSPVQKMGGAVATAPPMLIPPGGEE